MHGIIKTKLHSFRGNVYQFRKDRSRNRKRRSRWLQYRMSAQMVIVSSSGILVYNLTISKEQKKAFLGSMDVLRI